MSLLRQLLRKRDFLSYCLLIFLSLSFFWKFFLKGLVPIPADTIVGISIIPDVLTFGRVKFDFTDQFVRRLA